MSSLQVRCAALPTAGSLLEIAQDLTAERLATSSCEGGHSWLQMWEADGSSEWMLVSQHELLEAATHLVWAHPESGPLVAAATETGRVLVYEAPRPGGSTPHTEMGMQDEHGPGPRWSLNAKLKCSDCAVRHLCFAPRQHGLLLTVASDDGQIYFFEANRLLAPEHWTLQSRLQVPAQDGGGHGTATSTSGRCGAVCWRPFSPGMPPLLAVGNGGFANVWQYDDTHMVWQQAASLPLSDEDGTLGHSGTAEVTHLHWAPALGRPCELIVATHGNVADIFALTGDTHELVAQRIFVLMHEAAVWRAEWNQLGTCLAVATEAGEVAIWRSDLAGAWQKVAAVSGVEEPLLDIA